MWYAYFTIVPFTTLNKSVIFTLLASAQFQMHQKWVGMQNQRKCADNYIVAYTVPDVARYL